MHLDSRSVLEGAKKSWLDTFDLMRLSRFDWGLIMSNNDNKTVQAGRQREQTYLYNRNTKYGCVVVHDDKSFDLT